MGTIDEEGHDRGPDPMSEPGRPTPTRPVGPGEPGRVPATTGCQEGAPPLSPVRRLTRRQYGATVQDLVGAPPALGDLFPEDEQGEEVFDAASTLIVTTAWAESAMKASEQAAKAAMTNLAALVPCKPEAGDEACARQFIQSLGKRAFRRPLLPPEQTGLLAVYREGAAQGFASGIELVVTAMLQSPSFLYRLELGEPRASGAGGTVKLTPHEVAARLSYTLWGSMPDEPLTAAADAGRLATPDQVAAQARRLLADPRAHAALIAFHQRWLGIEALDHAMKDQERYPQFDERLRASMKSELERLFEDGLFNGDGRMESLLTTRVGFVDPSLASFYGAKGAAPGGFTRVELDPAQRTGILSRAGLLSAHTFADGSAPIHRGLFVRDRLLCAAPPNPPANVDIVAPEPPPNVSNREALAQHRADPSCKACHELMDPIGFAFGDYDGIGAWRTSDGGRPVDNSGYIVQSKDLDGSFRGVAELAGKLSGSAQVSECVMATVVGFVQGPDVAADACVLDKARTAFAAAKHDIRELVVAVTRTDGFQYRKALAGEVQP